MFLLVQPTGSKWWRLACRFGDKQKTLALGAYGTNETTLRGAREKREEARRQLAEGIDPGALRKLTKNQPPRNADSFEAVAREWFAKFSPRWAPSYAEKIMRRLERDIFPWIGALPVGEIGARELLPVLRRIEGRGRLETAHRALQTCSVVFRYAVATGRAERDPSGDLRGAIPPPNARHHAAIIDHKATAELLLAIGGYAGAFVTTCALRLAPLLFVRPGELRRAEWAEIDLGAAEWRIPAAKMKTRSAHVVPLADQALAILREIHPLTSRGRYVFPGAPGADRPMSAEKLTGPVSLFVLTIADSGERKSTCDRFFTKALCEYQNAQAELAKPAIATCRFRLAHAIARTLLQCPCCGCRRE